MLHIRYALDEDYPFWKQLDTRLSPTEFSAKVGQHRCYILEEKGMSIGLMRYNLFWDEIPFLTLVMVLPTRIGQGYGTQATLRWETDMRSLGYSFVMTSTQADESAQHFYRKLGYKDAGCLLVDLPAFSQPTELFFVKTL